MALGFQIELEFGNVGFCGGRKTGEPGEKPSEQGREPTTNSTHIWRQVQESNLGHIEWEVSALTTVPSLHPMLPTWLVQKNKQQNNAANPKKSMQLQVIWVQWKSSFLKTADLLAVYFSCSKIIAHVISDVYQFAHGSVATLWKISCQLLRTGLFNIKKVCYKEDPWPLGST